MSSEPEGVEQESVEPVNEKYTADKIVQMLRAKYADKAYAVLEQMPNGTGSRCTSWIDAAVFSLWPCNGIWRAAFEIKVSRADWLKELANPAKNEWARKHFNYFWYACAPRVAKEEELPEGCGLMQASGNGLKIVRAAQRREADLNDTLVVAMARSMCKETDRGDSERLTKAIEKDYRYQQALYWQQGVKQFLSSINNSEYCRSQEDVFKLLTKLSRDPQANQQMQDAKQTLDVLAVFQQEVAEFIQKMVPLAAHMLDARDETGRYIHSNYSLKDNASVEQLRATVKSKKTSRYDRDRAKKVLDVKQAIQS